MFKFVLTIPAWIFICSLQAQTDLVYPWVTNNSSFRAKVVIVNPNNAIANVALVATRGDGTQQTITLSVPAFGQNVETASEMFTGLGEGTGFTVRMTSASSGLQGGLVVSSTGTSSGDSPAQANVVTAASASKILLFTYLPNESAGFAGPVVVNMGSVETVATYRAYQNGAIVATTTRTLPAGRPFAEGVNTLFPEVSGDLYLVVEAEQKLIGVAFIFNALKEPSMANALSLSEVPLPETGNENPAVSFASQIQPIFSQNCGTSACHTNGGSQSGMNLDEGSAYNNIVNVQGLSFPSLNRIEPGSPDASLLYLKLTAPPVGQRMPRGRAALSEENLTLIREWILAGAPNN